MGFSLQTKRSLGPDWERLTNLWAIRAYLGINFHSLFRLTSGSVALETKSRDTHGPQSHILTIPLRIVSQ